MATGAPAFASTPSMKVELRISCKNLRDADVLSKSDPLVAVYTPHRNVKARGWDEVEHCPVLCVLNYCSSTPPRTAFCFLAFSLHERS